MSSRHNSASRAFLILAFVCAISVTSPVAQGSPRGGRLIVERVANFGWNVAVHLQIDGRDVANIVQGRRFDGFVPTGHHVLTVSAAPNYSYRQPTSIMLNVQLGRSIYRGVGLGSRCSRQIRLLQRLLLRVPSTPAWPSPLEMCSRA